jgi:hypothetical protein
MVPTRARVNPAALIEMKKKLYANIPFVARAPKGFRTTIGGGDFQGGTFDVA